MEIKNRYTEAVIMTVEAEALAGADLSDADLSEANLRWANLSGSDVRGADLSEADLHEANLSKASLSGANLSRANLSRANLAGDDLRGANLSEADLSEASLRRANLSGADLSGADLSGADLWNCVGNGIEVKSLQCGTYSVAYTAEVLQIGCQRHKIEDWWAFHDRQIAEMDSGALDWWRVWKPLLQAIIAASPAEPTGAEQ